RRRVLYSRRQFGRLALAGVALPALFPSRAEANSKISGVQIGAITYSYRAIPDAHDIVKAMAQLGLSEVELMSNHAEQLAGAPAGRAGGGGGRGRGTPTPEEQEAQRQAQDALHKWRLATSPGTFKAVRNLFATNGIQVVLLCYNLSRTVADDEIEYAFQMAKA